MILKFNDNLKYLKYFERLLDYYGFKLHKESRNMINRITKNSASIFEFFDKLKIDYNITKELKNEFTIILVNESDLYFAIDKKANIEIFTIDKNENHYIYEKANLDFIAFSFSNLNEVVNIINKCQWKKYDIILKNKIMIFIYIILSIFACISIYGILLLIRVTIDTYLYYKNLPVIILAFTIILTLAILYNIFKYIRKMIIKKFIKKKENLLYLPNEIDQKEVYVKLLLDYLSLPIMILFYLYILLNIQVNIFNFTWMSLTLVIGISVIFCSINNNERIDCLNVNEKIIARNRLIMNYLIIFIFLLFSYLNICLFFHDTISLGIISMTLGIYYCVIIKFYDIYNNIYLLKKYLFLVELLIYRNEIEIVRKNNEKKVNDFHLNIKIPLFYVGNKIKIKDLFLDENSINLFVGQSGSGKTLFAKTLSGKISGNLTNINLSGVPISQISKNELSKIVYYFDNEINDYSSNNLILDNNVNADINLVFDRLGINYLKNINDSQNRELTNTEKIKVKLAGILLNNYYILILDNIISRLDDCSINKILNLCKDLNLLVIVMEQKEITSYKWSKIIRI